MLDSVTLLGNRYIYYNIYKLKIREAEMEFEHDRIKNEYTSLQEQTRRDLILLKSDLEKEKSLSETERNKRLQQEKETAALQRLWNYPATGGALADIPTPSPVTGGDTESVISETDISISGVSNMDGNFSFNNSISSSSMIGPGIIETLQAQLKQREGEVYQFRAERVQAQSQREKLASEVVRLSAIADEVTDMKTKEKEFKAQGRAVERQMNELNQKYSALLTLYGEKVETVEELEMDLADVKELLKQQTEEWAAKIASS